jgi:hypothetical protein
MFCTLRRATLSITGGKGAKSVGYGSAVKKPYMFSGQVQKRRFIALDADKRCIWAQRQRWNNNSIRDCRLGIPWIGSGADGIPAFMSAREVSVVVDMVIDLLA